MVKLGAKQKEQKMAALLRESADIDNYPKSIMS